VVVPRTRNRIHPRPPYAGGGPAAHALRLPEPHGPEVA
jgi:hypothetical protein